MNWDGTGRVGYTIFSLEIKYLNYLYNSWDCHCSALVILQKIELVVPVAWTFVTEKLAKMTKDDKLFFHKTVMHLARSLANIGNAPWEKVSAKVYFIIAM